MNVTDSQLARLADEDLAEAERSARVVGIQLAHIAALRDQLAAGTDVAEVAAEAKLVRASLRAAEGERAALLERWSSLSTHLDELDERRRTVHDLAERCRREVPSPPALSVPSVAAARQAFEALSTTTLDGMSWPALRGRLSPVVVSVDRVASSLHDLERRCRALLAGAADE